MDTKICQFCKNNYKSKGDKRNFKNSKYCSLECFSNFIRGQFNRYEIIKGIIKIDCNKGIVLIDKDDLEKVNKCHWHINNVGYPCVKNAKISSLLHHLIIGKPEKGKVVDHINRNKLDNRKCNLRIVTHAENLHNTGVIKNNTSGYKGVTFCKTTKRWRPKISVNNKTINLGSYLDIKEAIITRKEAELKYWGKIYE